jgi:hypothetical protein
LTCGNRAGGSVFPQDIGDRSDPKIHGEQARGSIRAEPGCPMSVTLVAR